MNDGLMFADTLDTSWRDRARRGWMTSISFALQAIVCGLLLLLPLLHPTGLPSLRQISTPISLGEPLPEQPAIRPHGGSPSVPSMPTVIEFRQPTVIPNGIRPSTDDAPAPGTGSGPYIPGAVPGAPGGMPNLFAGGTRPVPIPAPPAPGHPVMVSHMREGDLIRKVQPAYPPLARSARIQGTVSLQAVISKQGLIENLRVISGHPMLAPAAIEAVRQWRYRLYILNNEPVEVETQITVNFFLNEN